MDIDFLIIELKNEIVKNAMPYFVESTNKPIAVYPGRFQPFHKGHYSVYKDLVRRFGKDRVYVATSNVTDGSRSPFSFEEKRKIISTLFSIPTDKIVKIKNPYSPQEIVSKYPEDTPLVVSVSEKDAERLSGGSYFSKWVAGKSTTGYKTKGYYIIAPLFKMDVEGGNISGTQIRSVFSDPNKSFEEKKKLFVKLYGKFDQSVFDLFMKKFDRKVEHPAEHIAPSSSLMVEAYLHEGGAAGHLMHPYEDPDLTFSELKDLIEKGLIGDLSSEAPVTEKTDGQNLAFSVKNGKIIFARTQAQLKNYGENGLSDEELKKKFRDKGEIEEGFSTAIDDLQQAINALPIHIVQDMFGNGSKFMSMEIINPKTKNVIPYDSTILQFHGAMVVDKDGKVIDHDTSAGKKFADYVRAHQAHKQKTYELRGPNVLVFSDADTSRYEKKYHTYAAALDAALQTYKLDDSNSLQDYSDAWWKRFITTSARLKNIKLSDKDITGLVKRWSQGDKSFGKNQLNPELHDWFRAIDSQHPKIKNRAIQRIEDIVLAAGADSIRRVTNLVSSNNPQASKTIQKQLNAVIHKILQSDDEDKLDNLLTQIRKLNATGGVQRVIPSEGMVFIHKGKLYKFTGPFAPVNQILGMGGFESKRTVPDDNDPSTRDITKKLSQKIKNPQTGRKILVRTALAYGKEHPAYAIAKQKLK